MSKKTIVPNEKSGYTAINNFIFWSYNHLDPSSKFLYIGILAQNDSFDGDIPSFSLVDVRQEKLANCLQTSYSTFRERLHKLKNIGLVGIDSDHDRKMCIKSPKQSELDRALEFKKSLVKSNKRDFVTCLNYTLVPNSLIYGHPELSQSVKYVYVFLKSLDWNRMGAIWYKKRTLATFAGIKYRTFCKYLRILRKANLIMLSKRFGFNKSTKVIFLNASCRKEQERAIRFKSLLKSFIKKIDRFNCNKDFEDLWVSPILAN